MTYERAFVILADQLAGVAMDGGKGKKRNNYMEALMIAIDLLHEKIKMEEANEID